MLKNTFCHIPGIGAKSERKLWDAGLREWGGVGEAVKLPRRRREVLAQHAEESQARLAAGDACYFCERLPSNQAWRLFPEFAHATAFLDIETTGLSGERDYITTIAVYDGDQIYTFVRGQNLDEFADCISRYATLVTYNGKTFDIPFIRQHMGLPMEQAHIDLRYILAGLGMKGGLKQCEKRLGLDRKELADIDGYFAVLLWQEYLRKGDRKALDTLLAYNIADVVNLASIMPLAYNMKLQETPFHDTHLLPLEAAADIPYEADMETVQRIKRRYGWG